MIFCIVVIWTVVLVQGIALTSESGEEKSVEVFHTLNLATTKGSVEVNAPINKLYLSQEEKKNVLIDLAEELGITSGFYVKEEEKEDMERVELRWTMDEEKVNLSITTIHTPIEESNTAKEDAKVENKNIENKNYIQNQYIYMTCEVKEDTEKLLAYKTLMEKMMNRRGLEPSTNLNLVGRQSGELTSHEKQEITDRLFHSLEATEVESVKEEELYTVYGYSNLLKNTVAYGENEINLNLAFTYDEEEKQTVFYLSMPYIRTDY